MVAASLKPETENPPGGNRAGFQIMSFSRGHIAATGGPFSMQNIRNSYHSGKVFVGFGGKRYIHTSQGIKLASKLDLALFRSTIRVVEVSHAD